MFSVSVAEAVALRLLRDDAQRLRHVIGVAGMASEVAAAGAVGPGEEDTLVAAAWVHDIGYASEVRDTGFHHLDGARWLRSQGQERLAALVAFHTGGCWEAECRGLAPEVDTFEHEQSTVSDALAYCDLHVDARGQRVAFQDRVDDICSRYEATSPVVVALNLGRHSLTELVARVDARCAAIR